MKNGIFKLGWEDLLDSLVSGVVVALIVATAGIVVQDKFSLFTVDWVALSHSMADLGIKVFFGILLKNLVSDNQGNILAIGSK